MQAWEFSCPSMCASLTISTASIASLAFLDDGRILLVAGEEVSRVSVTEEDESPGTESDTFSPLDFLCRRSLLRRRRCRLRRRRRRLRRRRGPTVDLRTRLTFFVSFAATDASPQWPCLTEHLSTPYVQYSHLYFRPLQRQNLSKSPRKTFLWLLRRLAKPLRKICLRTHYETAAAVAFFRRRMSNTSNS